MNFFCFILFFVLFFGYPGYLRHELALRLRSFFLFLFWLPHLLNISKLSRLCSHHLWCVLNNWLIFKHFFSLNWWLNLGFLSFSRLSDSGWRWGAWCRYLRPLLCNWFLWINIWNNIDRASTYDFKLQWYFNLLVQKDKARATFSL